MIFTQHEMQPQVGQILIQYAGVCRIAHEFSRAEELLRQAEAVWMERNHKFWLITVLFERINLALAQQKVTTALALLNTPLLLEQTNAALTAQRELLMAECLRQIPNDPVCQTQAQAHFDRIWSYALAQDNRWLQRETTAGLGQLLRHIDPDTARAYLERAVRYDDETRQMLSIEELKASFHLQASNILPILIRMAVSQGQPKRALSYAWKAKASAFADLIRLVTLQQTLTVAEQAEIQQIRQQIAARRWTLAKNASGHLGDSFQEMADPTLQELEHRLYALRRQRNREHHYSDEHLFADPAQTLARMEADSLLEYVRCDNEILAIYTERHGTWKAVWLCEVSIIQDILDDLQLNVQNVVYQHHENRVQFNNVWCAEALPLLERAYDLLIRPVLAEVEPLHLEHKLLIAPCEPLFLLPFAAFWNGQQYLFEQVYLEFIPSGGLLDVPIQCNPAQTLSCPIIVASSSEGTLRGTHAEVAAIATTLPDHNALVDSPQTLHILNNLSTPPRLLHIAAHSIVRTDAPILSAIQLTEDILSVEQCYELPLIGTELVVLSGCTTMTGLDTGGALLAFQSAFFIAGAKRILSSLWPIADDVTPVLMSHFYRLLIEEQLSPPAALRETQQILIKDPAYNHPAIWAAFVCNRR
ncbi:MAG: CHAT domain-containing protein [Caldilineaceae bacterium]|nr:CHAT domain-containing protein [Caldilineaceae bacterium]